MLITFIHVSHRNRRTQVNFRISYKSNLPEFINFNWMETIFKRFGAHVEFCYLCKRSDKNFHLSIYSCLFHQQILHFYASRLSKSWKNLDEVKCDPKTQTAIHNCCKCLRNKPLTESSSSKNAWLKLDKSNILLGKHQRWTKSPI